ncbi:WYL domain-containing protein [Campylobacter majalis]|uniref:WYL domain-containing protein n=1 Tax=Campylobacter majalis TaxID=2790656 RepID=UPI001E2B6E94|nr:WYL domain-containing protein [Campylobacter majalis]
MGYSYEQIDKKIFEILQNALQDEAALNFIYKGKIRAVNPYKILNLNGIWYLVATQK